MLTSKELNMPFDFAQFMSEKLKMNKDKGPWNECSLEYLQLRLMEEVGELITAIQKGDSRQNVVYKAADAANFAMMIAHKYLGRDFEHLDNPPIECPHCGAPGRQDTEKPFMWTDFDCGSYDHDSDNTYQSDTCKITEQEKKLIKLETIIKNIGERCNDV